MLVYYALSELFNTGFIGSAVSVILVFHNSVAMINVFSTATIKS
jgi:hypothetical protein